MTLTGRQERVLARDDPAGYIAWAQYRNLALARIDAGAALNPRGTGIIDPYNYWRNAWIITGRPECLMLMVEAVQLLDPP